MSPTVDANMSVADAVVEVRDGRADLMVRCNTHDDGNPSLHISPGKDQPVSIRCFAGCEVRDIIANAGLTWDDICTPRVDDSAVSGDVWTPGGSASHIYPYTDEQGTLLYEVLRVPQGARKTFYQRVPPEPGSDRHTWKLDGVTRVLYRLPEVVEGVRNGQTVHVCFSPDTEVLTEDGWVELPELAEQARVAQYGLNGTIEFVSPLARQHFLYEGDLINFRSNFSDALVTPDHRMLVKNLGCDPTTISADEVRALRYLPVAGVRRGNELDVTVDEARLRTAWQADGVNTARGHRVGWNVKKARKIERIHQLLDACGVAWKDQSFASSAAWTYVSVDRRDSSVLSSANKSFTWDMLYWSVAARTALLQELAYWDGDSTGREGVRFFTADEVSADVVVALASITGWGAIKRIDARQDKMSWVINLVPRAWRQIAKQPERVAYNGPVYCLTVPSSYLVTRRNGKVTIAGNCEGEKDADTLRRKGMVATCNPQGAGPGKWLPQFTEVLAGAEVIIHSDADDAGRAHSRNIRAELIATGALVEIREPAPPYKDVTALVEAGGSLDAELVVVPATEGARAKFGIDILDLIKRKVEDTEFVIPGTLARRERLIVTGFEGHGKALALDTVIPSPDGWTTMEKLDTGDRVFAQDGSITHVVATSEVMNDRPCYEVTFNDGTNVVADADHLWLTETLASREATARFARRGDERSKGKDQRHLRRHWPEVVTTEQIARSVQARGGHALNHSVSVAGALQFPERDLPIGPYTLGAWLGDGTSASAQITCDPQDVQIIDNIRKEGWTVHKIAGNMRWSITGEQKWRGSLSALLRQLGLLNNKHIPQQYLSGSVPQRLALLQGLMDTDGSVDRRGDCEFTSTRIELALAVHELATGLGIKASATEGVATLNGRTIGPKYRVLFRTDVPVFRLQRKAARLTTRTTARHRLRYIASVTPVESVPVKCVRVTHDSETYLITRNLIPTHNSTLLRQIGACAAAGIHPFTLAECDPVKVMQIEAENDVNQTIADWQSLVSRLEYHGRVIDRTMLTVLDESDNSELDLASPEGTAWLHERIHAYKPDLVIMGPLTNMVGRDLKDDEPVRRLKAAVNSARNICGSAFIMEHHAPHKSASDKQRSIRPYGSSMFLKWPDFGYGMQPDVDREGFYKWQKFRWPRVRTRSWPDTLQWGDPKLGDLPWKEAPPQ